MPDIELRPAESIALTVGLAQVLRGEEPMSNVAAVCVLALARLTGRHDYDEPTAGGEQPWDLEKNRSTYFEDDSDECRVCGKQSGPNLHTCEFQPSVGVVDEDGYCIACGTRRGGWHDVEKHAHPTQEVSLMSDANGQDRVTQSRSAIQAMLARCNLEVLRWERESEDQADLLARICTEALRVLDGHISDETKWPACNEDGRGYPCPEVAAVIRTWAPKETP